MFKKISMVLGAIAIVLALVLGVRFSEGTFGNGPEAHADADTLAAAVEAQEAFADEYDAETGIVDWEHLIRAARTYTLAAQAGDDVSALTAYYTGIKVLDMNGQDITSQTYYSGTDIGSLAIFTGLEELYLDETNITNLGALAQLTNLKILDLSGNDGLAEKGAIASLTNLQVLNLQSTEFTNDDFGPIVELQNLVLLNLSENEDLTAIGPLRQCASLKGLAVTGTGLTQLQEVASFPNVLEILDARDLKLTMTQAISGLVMMANREAFDPDNVTMSIAGHEDEMPAEYLWDLSGSEMSADADGHIAMVQAKFRDGGTFNPPMVGGNQLPAPTNLKWVVNWYGSTGYRNANWDEIGVSGDVKWYLVKAQIGDAEPVEIARVKPSEGGHSTLRCHLDDFIQRNGTGTYSFSVQTISIDGVSDSIVVWSPRKTFYKLTTALTTTPEGEEGGDVMLIDGDEGGGQNIGSSNTTDERYVPAGTKVIMQAEADELFDYTVDTIGVAGEVTKKDDRISFTMTGDSAVSYAFTKTNRLPVPTDTAIDEDWLTAGLDVDWDPVEGAKKYELVFTWKSGEETASETVVTTGSKPYDEDPQLHYYFGGDEDADSFVEKHGPGEYSVTIKAIPPEGSSAAPSKASRAVTVEVVSLTGKVVVKGTAGETLTSGGSVNLTEEIGEITTKGSSIDIEDGKKTYYLPYGTELYLEPEADKGIGFVEFDFGDKEPDDYEYDKDDNLILTVDDNYEFTAKFRKSAARSTVNLELGKGHEQLAAAIEAALNEETPGSCTREGTKITFETTKVNTKISDAIKQCDEYVRTQTWPDKQGTDAGQRWWGANLHPLSYYADEDAADDDYEKAEETAIGDSVDLYMLWLDPVTTGNFSVKALPCGTNVTGTRNAEYPWYSAQDPTPSVTADADSHLAMETYGRSLWFTSDDIENLWEFDVQKILIGKATGGNTYYSVFPMEPKWGYYIDTDHLPTVKVNGVNATVKTYGYFKENLFTIAAVKTEHSWDSGKVTRKATIHKEGVFTYTCKACGQTKTKPIAKLKLKTTEVYTYARLSQSGMLVTWDKVKGGNGYKVAWRKRGGKWKTKRTKALAYTAKTMNWGKLYEYKVALTKKATKKAAAVTGPYSKVKYRYYKYVSGWAYGRKGAATFTWLKDRKADGYIVYYATNREMRNPKAAVVKGRNRTSYTFKGLKSGKTYYMMVRPYKVRGGHRYDGITCLIKPVRVR